MNQVWNNLDGILDVVWTVVATGLIHGTVLAALTALAAATLLRRASPALLGGLWTIVLVKFVVPLGPDLPVSLSGLVESLLAGSGAHAAGADAVTAGVAAHPGAYSTAAVLWLLGQSFVLLAYFGLVLWLLRRRVAGLRAMRRWAESGEPAGEAVLAAVAHAAGQLGVSRIPAVRLHRAVSTPQIVGLWRPVLVIPTWLTARDQLAAALLHELAHLRRRDPWVHALQLVVGTLLCAWPVVHWVNRRIAMYREIACDQWALACGPLGAGSYARMLVVFARRMAALAPAPALGLDGSMALLGGRKQIEHRVDALLRGAARPRLGRVSAVVLAVWALLSLGSTRHAEAGGGTPECVLTADMVAQLLQHFPEADLDRDGVLTREEMCAHRARIQRALDAGDAAADLDGLTAPVDQPMISAGEIAEFKENWDAMGLADCAACNCSAAAAQDDMSRLAPVETKICISEDK
jgi:beta-lactamase regulating signal transducer with metallopeptidase domain